MAATFADADFNGGELETRGFVCLSAPGGQYSNGIALINGYGVVTFGFLCSCTEIWDNVENDNVSTTWTVVSGGVYGDCVY